MDIPEIDLKQFDYYLPEDKIARYPLAERDLSKLLIYRNRNIEEDIFRKLDEYIESDTLLIFNNTRVLRGRLFFKNSTGARIEIFCLEDLRSSMAKNNIVQWKCLVGNAKKWKEKYLELVKENFTLRASVVEKKVDHYIVEFSWQPDHFSFNQVLEKAGIIPIPPYLGRQSEEIDIKRYQTVYAKKEGSVAAPTAGLHFTDKVFEKLQRKGIVKDEVTLHVGAGTFIPIKGSSISEHNMHAEWIGVNLETIKNIHGSLSKRKLIATGTTSLRLIESLYWMGLKAYSNKSVITEEPGVSQWDPYRLKPLLGPASALEELLSRMEKNNMKELFCQTQLMIIPSYNFKFIQGLITNFHQPKSTLLLIVAALCGDGWKNIYQYALHNNFRFLSYGDASILYGEEH